MNILSLFPLIPLVMMLGLWISKNTRQIHAVMVAGSSALLALAIYLVFHYLGLREAGATDAMLLTDSVVWYAPLNIHYAVGVDGISVAMLLLSAIIVFTGTFASWQMKSDVKAYFLWFCLLSVGVFGFFISVDLFTMFMFYEVALIPMYLLIGVWGSGRKEYAAMKLTLMLMGGSAFLLIGILGIYYGAGAEPMNILEIAIRPTSLCMRLFGNVLGAFVIMELIKLVVPVFVPAIFSLYFDLFDGLIQTYVFVFLTSLFMKETME